MIEQFNEMNKNRQYQIQIATFQSHRMHLGTFTDVRHRFFFVIFFRHRNHFRIFFKFFRINRRKISIRSSNFIVDVLKRIER